MRRIALYAGVLGVLGMASLAVADLAVDTDEERIDDMLHEVASARGKSEAILHHVDLAAVPLEISSGRHLERYDRDGYDELLSQASDLDEQLGARPMDVRQSEIQVHGAEAHVVVNFAVGGDADHLVPCDIELRKVTGRWLIQRLRVMS
jgi:hypothetical protein